MSKLTGIAGLRRKRFSVLGLPQEGPPSTGYCFRSAAPAVLRGEGDRLRNHKKKKGITFSCDFFSQLGHLTEFVEMLSCNRRHVHFKERNCSFHQRFCCWLFCFKRDCVSTQEKNLFQREIPTRPEDVAQCVRAMHTQDPGFSPRNPPAAPSAQHQQVWETNFRLQTEPGPVSEFPLFFPAEFSQYANRRLGS